MQEYGPATRIFFALAAVVLGDPRVGDDWGHSDMFLFQGALQGDGEED